MMITLLDVQSDNYRNTVWSNNNILSVYAKIFH